MALFLTIAIVNARYKRSQRLTIIAVDSEEIKDKFLRFFYTVVYPISGVSLTKISTSERVCIANLFMVDLKEILKTKT